MLSFFKELFASIKFNARERTTNVYIGALAFSWITINWKFWMILLFGDGTVDVRIEHVESLIGFSSGVVLPILMSAAICFILPKINKAITQYQNEPNNYVKRVNDISESKSLKRLARIERLRAKAASARDRENAAQELAIQQLNEQIQESKDQSQKLSQENVDLTQRLSELSDLMESTISQKEIQIAEMTKSRNNEVEISTNLNKTVKRLEAEISQLKKNIASNKPGVGLPTYKSSSTPSLTDAQKNLAEGNPATRALEQTLNNTALQALGNNQALRTITAVKTRLEADDQTRRTITDAARKFADRNPFAEALNTTLNTKPITPSDDLENK